MTYHLAPEDYPEPVIGVGGSLHTLRESGYYMPKRRRKRARAIGFAIQKLKKSKRNKKKERVARTNKIATG